MSWCWLSTFLILGLIWAQTCASPAEKFSSALLGAEECLDGPSYWCQNFTTARHCNANRHCIRTVWEHMVLPPDNGEICETCKKMVAQARDELQSNETQENLKLVLEGSCQILIPIKVFAKECIKAVDEFIPELVEALASQMDPQAVCSVAGLCNSARLDKLLAEYKASSSKTVQLDCDNCAAVAGIAEKNFRQASRDDVLNAMLSLCGRTGSYSDGCATNVIIYFNKIYEALSANLYPAGLCHYSGVCHGKFHSHSKEVEVKPVPKLEGDLPCELCQQLVEHVRDIMVANTTEKEFEQVLLGICTQTGKFKKECVDLVETYYPVIYKILSEELDPNMICSEIGICPKPALVRPLNPLIPVEVADKLEKTPSKLYRVPVVSSGVAVHSGSHSLEVSEAVLPLDTLTVVPQDKQLCQMCEYFLHFLQQEITDPINEQAIQKAAEKACNGLPDKFAPVCRSFVDTYTPAVIALLAQDIDPSQICPSIGVCPGVSNSPVQCEPCKTTTTGLVRAVGMNTSEANIKKELMALCLSLEFEDSRYCSQVVRAHHEDLMDMVTAEFTGEEMCFYMKYCKPQSLAKTGAGNTETNEISKAVVNKQKDDEICVLCEFIMKTVEKDLGNNKTEAEIRYALEHVCYVLPKTIKTQCTQFVDTYIDLIVTMLAKSVSPKEICQAINLCLTTTVNMELVHKSVTECVVCESLMGALQGVIADKDIQSDINQQLEVACMHLPQSMRSQCQDIVHQMAPQIEAILQELPVGSLVCRRLNLCGQTQTPELVTVARCSEGQQYWCQSTIHAATCQKIEFCQKNVWFADKPNKKRKFSAKKYVY